MKKHFLLSLSLTIVFNINLLAQEVSNWTSDIGISFFKSSLINQPDELLYNPVFTRWESINQQPNMYLVSDYKPLSPYIFNLNIGADYFLKYKKYLMIKIGFGYTNTLIGGIGNISYTDKLQNISYSEKKEMGYSSYQITYFIGPCVPISENGSEIFMGFSIMSPTWVVYNEKYTKMQNTNALTDYNKTFKGFFGNCRSMIGIQVPVFERFKFGTEMVFAYFNGIELKSGSLTEQGFKFPAMQWNFTCRYRLK